MTIIQQLIASRSLMEDVFTPEAKDTAKKVGIGAGLGGLGIAIANNGEPSEAAKHVAKTAKPAVQSLIDR